MILAVDSHLVPFGLPEETRHQVRRASTAGTAPAAAAPAAHPETEHGSGGGGGIGATIKKIFRRTSSSAQGTAAHAGDAHPSTTSGAESAVSDETAVNAPLNSLEGHHQLEEQTQDKSYPAYVHGSPVKYIVVPLGALDYKTITIKEEKGVWVVKVPVSVIRLPPLLASDMRFFRSLVSSIDLWSPLLLKLAKVSMKGESAIRGGSKPHRDWTDFGSFSFQLGKVR